MKKTLREKTILTLVFIVIAQLFFSLTNKSIMGVIYSDGPYYGQVVDFDTGEPIEGAVVATIWKFDHSVPLIANLYSFANATEDVTSKDGRYFLPKIWAFTFWPLTAELTRYRFVVFRSGYDKKPIKAPKAWTEEDIKKRGMTRREYAEKHKITCDENNNCLIKLSKIKTLKEAKVVVHTSEIYEVPPKHRDKIRNLVKFVNDEQIRLKQYR